jgi:hypothetical protein
VEKVQEKRSSKKYYFRSIFQKLLMETHVTQNNTKSLHF